MVSAAAASVDTASAAAASRTVAGNADPCNGLVDEIIPLVGQMEGAAFLICAVGNGSLAR